jgi:hypothetical protein
MLINTKICTFSVTGTKFDDMYVEAFEKMNELNSLDFDKYKPTFSFEHKTDKGLNTLEISVYLKIDSAEVEDKHCQICQSFHTNFFINTRYNCDACEYNAYKKREDEKVKHVKSMGREVVKKFAKR